MKFQELLESVMRGARYMKSNATTGKKQAMVDRISQQAIQDKVDLFIKNLTQDEKELLTRFSRKVLEPIRKIVLMAIEKDMTKQQLLKNISEKLK